MANALDAVLTQLSSSGVGVPGSTLFAGTEASLPSTPTGIVSVVETGGGMPIPTHENLTALRQPSFQVVARAQSYRAASNLSRLAYEALILSNTLVDGVFFLLMAPMQEPFSLPNDASGRVRIAFNIRTIHRK